MKRKMGDYIFRSYFKRKFVNAVMCSALGFATVAMVVPLFLVFGYALFQGAPALNWSFFTELPKPVGELGGGMANALLGTTTVVGIAAFIGVPWGVAIGVWLSEYGQKNRLAGVIRFAEIGRAHV